MINVTSWYINNITIDSRERTRGYNAYNYYIDQYTVHVEQLEYGDYLFKTNDDKNIIFEFKTCLDFIHSMEDKSLFNELSNQTSYYEYSYLIISGDFEEAYNYLYYNVPHYRYKYKTGRLLTNRLTKQVNGALNRIFAMQIPIIFVKEEEESFERMIKISSKIADNKKYGGIVRQKSLKLTQNPYITFLTSIHGIGELKAKNIINELNVNTLKDLYELKPSDFLSVTQINKKNVYNIWKTIHNTELNENEL